MSFGSIGGARDPDVAAHRIIVSSDDLLTTSAVRAALGNPTEMTLWRWTRDRGFPKPDVVIARRKFWRRSTIQQWIAAQVAKGANA